MSAACNTTTDVKVRKDRKYSYLSPKHPAEARDFKALDNILNEKQMRLLQHYGKGATLEEAMYKAEMDKKEYEGAYYSNNRFANAMAKINEARVNVFSEINPTTARNELLTLHKHCKKQVIEEDNEKFAPSYVKATELLLNSTGANKPEDAQDVIVNINLIPYEKKNIPTGEES